MKRFVTSSINGVRVGARGQKLLHPTRASGTGCQGREACMRIDILVCTTENTQFKSTFSKSTSWASSIESLTSSPRLCYLGVIVTSTRSQHLRIQRALLRRLPVMFDQQSHTSIYTRTAAVSHAVHAAVTSSRHAKQILGAEATVARLATSQEFACPRT